MRNWLLRKVHPAMLALFAFGCFLNIPFDIFQGKYGAAIVGLLVGIGVLSILPRPKRRRI
jgi:hypothetical protein